MSERIKKLIEQGENSKVELKQALFEFPSDAYETICAFLNSQGGTLILGVNDNSEIIGISPDCVNNIKNAFTSAMNNPNIINPTVCIELKEKNIENKIILYANIPESSVVHRHNNKVFIRNDKSDVNVTNNNRIVSDLYRLKDTTYTENEIYPYLKIADLRKDLIQRVKKLAKLNNEQNDWAELDDEQFLKRTSLYRSDFVTGKQGITLAGILFFGTDEQIASVVPAFKFDLIKQVEDTERYDDRLTLRTNLLDCFDSAMKFISNNLPAPFYMDGTRRINLRENIFRELIANMLVHKEYIGAEPTRLIIGRNKIIAENTSKPYRIGYITPDNVTNHPKNPNIIKIFRGIGYVEELGSGISKIFKYCREYAKHNPIIKDDTLFTFELKHNLFSVNISPSYFQKTIFELDEKINQKTEQVGEQVNQKTEQVGEQVNQKTEQVGEKVYFEKTILEFCVEPKSLKEILIRTGYTSRHHFKSAILNPLIDKGLIQLTQPESINSPTQKYITIIKNENSEE